MAAKQLMKSRSPKEEGVKRPLKGQRGEAEKGESHCLIVHKTLHLGGYTLDFGEVVRRWKNAI